ncbi:MAG: hypothetical protein RML49_02410 [Verrucomicrobiae bacterium]|nr:hypothetical protein [Verrucomicrobiae bacterium]
MAIAILLILIGVAFTSTLTTIQSLQNEVAILQKHRDSLTRRNQFLEDSINTISADHRDLLEKIKKLQAQADLATQLQNQIRDLEAQLQAYRSSPPQTALLSPTDELLQQNK